MNKDIVKILQIENLTARSYIALSIPITLNNSIHACQQNVMANIKLSIVVKKRTIYIRLDNVSHWLTILVLTFFK